MFIWLLAGILEAYNCASTRKRPAACLTRAQVAPAGNHQFRVCSQALQSARESKAQPSNPPAPILGPQGPPPKPSPKPQPSKPRITAKPVFRAKPVAPAAAGNSVADTAGNASDTPSAQDHQGLQALSAQRPEEGSQPPAKRAKAEAQAAAEQAGSDADEGQGFALLGGYASSDDAD